LKKKQKIKNKKRNPEKKMQNKIKIKIKNHYYNSQWFNDLGGEQGSSVIIQVILLTKP
jgi:hypothetical protein